MIGWVNQLIFGVAWWLFPILPLNKNQEQKEIKLFGILLTEKLKENEPYKGNKYLAWSLYFSLNLGLILRAIFEPYNVLKHDDFSAFCLVISAIAQLYSVFCFVFLLWRRVRYKK